MDGYPLMGNSKVQQAYNRIANHYNDVAMLHRQSGEQLIENLQYLELKPKRILDLGCGTGHFTQKLQALYPEAEVIGIDFSENMLAVANSNYPDLTFIQANVMKTNLAEHRYDLLFCNGVLHWLAQPQEFFIEAKRLLATSGALLFTTFGPDTLKELQRAWATISNQAHVNQFIDMHDLGDGLRELHFFDPVLSMEKIIFTAPDVITLLQTIKSMGSSFLGEHAYVSRQEFQQLENAYLAEQGSLPVTCEIIYGHARQSAQLNVEHLDQDGVVKISVAQLRASRNPQR